MDDKLDWLDAKLGIGVDVFPNYGDNNSAKYNNIAHDATTDSDAVNKCLVVGENRQHMINTICAYDTGDKAMKHKVACKITDRFEDTSMQLFQY